MGAPSHTSPTARPLIPRWKLVAVAALLYPSVIGALVHDATVREWTRTQGDLERKGPRSAWEFDQVALIERASRFASDPATKIVYHDINMSMKRWNLVIPGLGAFSKVGNDLQMGFHDTSVPGLEWNSPGRWTSNWAFSTPYYNEAGYVVVTMWGQESDCERILERLSPYTLSRIRAAWSQVSFPDASEAFEISSWEDPGQALQACRAGRGNSQRDTFLMRLDVSSHASAHAGP